MATDRKRSRYGDLTKTREEEYREEVRAHPPAPSSPDDDAALTEAERLRWAREDEREAIDNG